MLRVVIVGEIRLYRDGVAQFLASTEGVEVLGTGTTAGDLLRLAREKSPDVVLVDIAMPHALEAIRELSTSNAPVRIVALTVPEIEREVLSCVEAGVAGYVPRDGSLEDLLMVLRLAARGEATCSPKMQARLWERLAQLARAQDHDDRTGALTTREREIMDRVERGLSNKQIAAQLCIEPATVKNHVHNILEKLHVHRRGEAVAAMRRSGFRTAASPS